MHESEITRLLEQVSSVLADVAAGIPSVERAKDLRIVIAHLSTVWQAEEAEYVKAVTNHHCD